MTAEIIDNHENLIWKGVAFELAGKQYTAPEYVLNLIKHSKTNVVKNFKNAYEERQRTLGDRSTYNNQKFADKAVEILEEATNNNRAAVPLIMKHVIENNERNIIKEFSNKYLKEYAKSLPSKE